ncbi:MAG TPA: NAD(P)-dependent oxidoreductase [Bryobacteraceae bacterium]|jgi:3-hydroxyisobutyrate dehydrogenase-like beta-hydroxyacid dehydrogenase
MHLAFIGLGKMGVGMARNLIRGGHRVAVYNRTRAKSEALIAAGARVALSPAQAALGCEAAFTMLADDASVEEVVFGNDGLLSTLARGAVHIASTTMSTALSRRLAVEHARRGQQFVATPVFGRPEAAENKHLIVVAAGPFDAVERCQPLFEAIGRQTFIAGKEPWQANVVKLCGNFMIASLLECFGEANAILRKAGAAPQLFLDVINTLMGSAIYANYGRMITEEQFEPAGFALALGLKDIRLALAAADELAAPMPVASLLKDQFLAALARGQGDLDWSSVSQVAARNAGL